MVVIQCLRQREQIPNGGHKPFSVKSVWRSALVAEVFDLVGLAGGDDDVAPRLTTVSGVA
jgi:hypothetical protein